ncbi:hypothetical protein GJW-30_1_03713 [Variibacter gotjawalensis]|uniref:Uncharacterized protein n=1 Tax=Variibacter gotjawalensis TaxID=1333996 RepID=A0A0S3PZ28_9BRAD|nr:hypothetical protein [Variibacter gotjawalensis]NIK46993.1 ABC-type hemin transport system substrate-binding protein [Variibacter gotjawalensis]RZS48897.1 hypothetical protein EV661_1320 [Variibacter gotjawalensis]BAT61156.1 hypothetical protein GJW-30_1_03713 [Variibacter gotjawalensis]
MEPNKPFLNLFDMETKDHLRARAQMLEDLANQLSTPQEAERLLRQAQRYRQEAEQNGNRRSAHKER